MSRKMKDSGVEWIGEIPEEWELRRAKALLTPVSIKNKDPNVVLLAATQDRGVIPKNEVGYRTVVIADENVFNLKVIRQGQFCITLRSFQGGIEYCSVSGGISSGYTVLELNQSQEKDYFKYLLKSQGFIQELNKYKVSIRDGQNLPFSKVGETLLPVVPLSEQQAIADYLDTKVGEIDTNISKLKTASALLSELKQSVIYEAVTGKTFEGKVIDRKMKDSEVEWIGEIPEGWSVTKLKKIAQISTGYTPNAVDPAMPSSLEVSYITTDLLQGACITHSPAVCVEQSSKTWSNAVLVSGIGDIGRVGQVAGKFICNQQIHVVQSQHATLGFIKYSLVASKNYLRLNALSTVIPILNATKLKNLITLNPSLSEQQAIADYLDRKVGEIDNKISIIERKIELLAELKQSVIYEAVTGKIDVRVLEISA